MPSQLKNLGERVAKLEAHRSHTDKTLGRVYEKVNLIHDTMLKQRSYFAGIATGVSSLWALVVVGAYWFFQVKS